MNIKKIILEEIKSFDTAVSSNDNICDIFSINSMKQLKSLINKTPKITKQQRKQVDSLLKQLEKSNSSQSNDLDNFDTTAHKISTILCRNQDNIREWEED